MIATSTALLIAGLAGAAGTAAGAKMSSDANKRATQAQGRSTDAALQFEREREAQRRKEYDDALAMQKQQWEARQRTRQALARRYGVNLPTYSFSPSSGGASGASSSSAAASASPRLSLGSLMSPATSDPTSLETSLSGAGDAPPQTLGDLAGWEQWQKYGLA